ncbi:MAG: molybdopterin-dependent oxidoreductase [Candidatus Odinarchaeota archaeon]
MWFFYAADDYNSSLTIEEATENDVLLAYEMNSEVLPPEHRFPIRVVAPNQLGYKWVKWVVRIEIVNYDYKGYWESRG